MKFILLITILLGLLSSCGTPEGKTAAKFQLAFAATPFSSGGLMIFGKKEDATGIYLSKNIVSGTEVIELPNGLWSFITIAWNGPGAFQGSVKCARNENISLNGGDQDVVLNYNFQECQQNDVFGEVVSQQDIGQFAPLTVLSCSNQYAINESEAEDYADDCIRGATLSYRLRIPEFSPEGGVSLSTGLTSGCIDGVGPTSPVLNSSLRVPFFNDREAPLTVIVEAFENYACAGTPETFNFKNDLGSRVALDHYQNKNFLFLKRNYCTATHRAGSILSNGIMYKGNTHYVICNSAQFLDAFTNYPTNMYILGDNINFGGADLASYSMSIGSGGSLFGDGKTLSNITYNYTGTVNSNGVIFDTIQGNIEGVKISGVTADFDFNGSTQDGAGVLFGTVNASPSVTLKKIDLDNVQMRVMNSLGGATLTKMGLVGGDFQANTGEAKSITIRNSTLTIDGIGGNESREIGLVFGLMDGGLKDVNIVDSSILAGVGNSLDKIWEVGGAVGKTATRGDLNHVDVERVNIVLDRPAQAIGGVVGALAESHQFSHITSSGNIVLTDNTVNSPDIGGIAGIVTHGGTFNGQMLMANIDIDADQGAFGGTPVGGIFGKTSGTPADIKMAYYNGTLKGRSTCGGIIGNQLGGNVTHSMSEGVIDCAGGTSGGIVATSTGAISNTHSKMTINTVSGSGTGGIVGTTTSSVTNSYYEGTMTNNTAFHGLLVGVCTSCSLQYLYSLTGQSSQTGIGTNSTGASITNCGFIDTGSGTTGNCSHHPDLATLNSVDGATFTGTDWELAADGKYRLRTDKFFNRYKTTVGTRRKPIALSSFQDWRLVGETQLAVGNSALERSTFILMADLDFQNNAANFIPWERFGGFMMGNDNAIINVSFTDSSGNLGLIRELLEGVEFDHETPTGYKKLYLKNINLTNTGAGATGALGGMGSSGGGWMGFYGIELYDSSITGGAETGGLVGNITGSVNDFLEFEDIKIVRTNVTSTATSGVGVGGLAGSLMLTSVPTNKTLLKVGIDTDSHISAADVNVSVGGLVGRGTSILGAGLISRARLSGNTIAGGVVGTSNSSMYSIVEVEQDFTTCSTPTNCGGIIGNSSTDIVSNALNIGKINGSYSPIFGTETSGTFTNSISADGNSYSSSSTAITTSAAYFGDRATSMSNFDFSQEAFIFEETGYPRLRWTEFIKKLAQW